MLINYTFNANLTSANHFLARFSV